MEEKNNIKYEEIEDKNYYAALQDSLQSYDAKLWLMPGLFFVIVGFAVKKIDVEEFFSIENGIFFLICSILICQRYLEMS